MLPTASDLQDSLANSFQHIAGPLVLIIVGVDLDDSTEHGEKTR